MNEYQTMNNMQRLLVDIESRLTKTDREKIRRGMAQGINDFKEGRYQEYDENRLRNLVNELVVSSAKRHFRRSNAR